MMFVLFSSSFSVDAQRQPYNFEAPSFTDEFPPTGDESSCSKFGNETPKNIIGQSQGSITFTSQLSFKTLSGYAVINGTLIIDSPFSFNDAYVKMGAYAKIQIVDNSTFNSNASAFYACKEMWNGIVVSNGCSIRSLQSSFEDAITAFTIDDNVQCIFYGNIFNKNYIGIKNGKADFKAPGMNLHIFWVNTFTCTETLLEPHKGEISLTGFKLDRCAVSIGSSKTDNTFTRMRHGILAESSAFSVTNCLFSDFYRFDDSGGYGIHAIESTLDVDGMGQSFSNCGEAGIHAIGSNLTTQNCNFLGSQVYGIYTNNNLSAEKIHLHDNYFLLDNPNCINAVFIGRSLASGSIAHCIVNNNTMDLIEDKPIHKLKGIFEGANNPASDIFEVFGNTIYISSSHSDLVGIDIIGGSNKSNNHIHNNYISFASSSPAIGTFRYGIWFDQVSGGSQIIEENTITGFKKNGQCGIHLNDSPIVSLCGNNTDDLVNGLHLSGNCSISNIGANSIGRSNKGYFIQNTTLSAGETGIQTRMNNTWLPNSSDYTVLAAHNAANKPNNSKIIVENSNPTLLAITRDPFPLGEWFDIESGSNNSCRPTGNKGLEKLSLVERDILNGEYEEYNFSDVQLWDYHYRMMIKFVESPDLQNAGEKAAAFYEINKKNNIGKLAEVATELNGIALFAENHQINLNGLAANQQETFAALANIDNSFTEVPDEIDEVKAAQKGILLAQLYFANEKIISTKKALYKERSSLVSSILEKNNAIQTNYTQEFSRQKLNNLCFARFNFKEWSSNDYHEAYTLASLDIQKVGSSAYEAKILLPYTVFDQFNTPDEHSAEGRTDKNEKKQTISENLVISPNPSNGFIEVKLPKNTIGNYIVTDIFGKVVKNGKTESHSLYLDLTDLQSGFYTFIFSSTTKQQYTSKFSVANY